MKRLSGNGTWNVQFIYTLINVPCIWVWKIGITGKSPRIRRRQIDKSAFGFDLPIFLPLPLVGAYQVEQFIHSVGDFFGLQYGGIFKGTDGWTERYWFPVGIFGVVVISAVFVIEWGSLFLVLWVIIND